MLALFIIKAKINGDDKPASDVGSSGSWKTAAHTAQSYADKGYAAFTVNHNTGNVTNFFKGTK